MTRPTFANNWIPVNYWWIYLAAVCAWMVVTSLLVPEAPGGDIFILKDPGINLATGHGYVSCSMPDNPSLDFKVHASYPPVFPMLYAGYVSVFGFGGKQNMYFELACWALRNASLLVIVFLIIDSSRIRKIFLAICCLTIPISLGAQDRPEDLSLAFVFLSLALVYSANRVQAVILASLINGITCFMHPFGGIITILTGSVLLLTQLHQRPELNRVQWLGAWILPPFVLIISVWITLEAIAPDLVRRFLVHGTQVGGIHFVATSDGRALWWGSFLSEFEFNYPVMIQCIALVLVELLNLVFFWRFGGRRNFIVFLLVLLWFLTPFLVFFSSFAYRPYAAITLTVFTSLWLCSLSQKPKALILFCLGIAILLLGITPIFAKSFIARCLLTVSNDYDRTQIHRFIPEDPQGKFFVAADPSDYFDLKATNKIYYSSYSPLDQSVKYMLILDDPGLLARIHQNKPTYPPGYVPEEWEVIHCPDIKMGNFLRFFIVPQLLGTSAKTVYRRKSP